MKKFLIIIPARGGSKGIKNKNIVAVCKRPLLSYTIRPALKLKKEGLVDEVVVSTDSKKIAEIAKGLGAAAPFLRPKGISGDKAKSIDFVLHAINYFSGENISFDAVIVLQPTSPLRRYEDVKNAIKIYLQRKNDSLISVYREEKIKDLYIYYKEGDLAVPLQVSHNKGVRRQDQKNIYIRNGAIYISAVSYIKKSHKIISDRPLLYEMPKDSSLNIDSPEDLEMLRKILCK